MENRKQKRLLINNLKVVMLSESDFESTLETRSTGTKPFDNGKNPVPFSLNLWQKITQQTWGNASSIQLYLTLKTFKTNLQCAIILNLKKYFFLLSWGPITLDWIWIQTFWSKGTAFIRFTAEDKITYVGTYLVSNRKYFLKYWVS